MTFTFHQALFGYDGGHQLLATSLHLSNEARHSLAVATDISGSAPAHGFDRTFTGMPLPGTEFYALFCTWLAPEMPRPGCVWSQVLLIELPDLAELRDLGALHSLFVRPVVPTELDTFSRPLHYQAEPERPLRLPLSNEPVATFLIEALYTDANRPVVLAATDVLAYEELIFSLWSQQWPRLRRNFIFSTGSFADRGRSGPAFDLQIAPAANLQAWPRNGKHLIIDTYAKSQEVEPWVTEILDDLLAPDSRGLRSFMSQYGVDLINPRGSLVRLVKAFQRTRHIEPATWIQTLQSIAQDFPEASDAIRLKEWVLTPQTSVGNPQELELGWATISFLLNDPIATAYSSASFDYVSLVTQLWHERRQDLLDLVAHLLKLDATPAASSFASAITKVVNPEDLHEVWELHPELLSAIIRLRPNMALSADAWHLPITAQRRVLESLTQSNLEKREWGDLLVPMLASNADIAGKEAVVRAGPFAIEAAYRWAETAGMRGRLPSNSWRDALGLPALDQLNSMHLPPLRLALCAWLAPVDSVRKIAAGRPDVQELARESIEEIPKPLHLPTAFFLTTLGLRSEDNAGLPLVARGYATVHAALAADDYPWESWELLSPLLPSLGWFRDWDKCEKLRRALRDWLTERGIRRDVFEKTAEKFRRQYAPERH